jgi:hypothetical protein
MTLRTKPYADELDEALVEAVERPCGDTTLLDLMRRNDRLVARLRRCIPNASATTTPSCMSKPPAGGFFVAQRSTASSRPACRPRPPHPPTGELWLHEIKHDGFRVIARKHEGRGQPLETLKILYVEDNDDNVYMLKMRLELLGEFEVLAAEDGEKGCEIALRERIMVASLGPF